jgi:hypothetical protein
MQYAASRSFRGDAERAFRLAESALTAIGFQITARTAGLLEAIGPGMNSSRQSALLGASRIRLVHGHGELAVEAELGGAAWMSRFITLFPIALVLGLGGVLAVVFSMVFRPGLWLIGVVGAVGLNTALWLWLGPRMARGIRARTDRALDALLANMASVGESA